MKNKVKILATADLHGDFSKVGKEVESKGADILIIAGDVVFYDDIKKQQKTEDFEDAAKGVLALHKAHPDLDIVLVVGNHDGEMHKAPGHTKKRLVYDFGLRGIEKIHCLDKKEFAWTSRDGIKIVGIPWKASKKHEEERKYTDFGKRKKEALSGADILVVHLPPYIKGQEFFECSKAIARTIACVKPRCVVTGHLHHNVGKYDLDGIPVYNVAKTYTVIKADAP